MNTEVKTQSLKYRKKARKEKGQDQGNRRDSVSPFNIRPQCKQCGSQNVIRYGEYCGIRRWWCKDCQHKFADNDALPNMRIPVNQVAMAISMYYEGRSLSDIPRILCQLKYNVVSTVTVSNWINRFSKIAINKSKKDKVNAGDIWVIYESSIKICGKNYWIIDIIDLDTWFLLGTKLSPGCSIADIKSILEMAFVKVVEPPKKILICDRISYREGIEQVFGADVQCISNNLGNSLTSFSKLTRFWEKSYQDRCDLIHLLKNNERARVILDGWMVHYNYFRIRYVLDSKTPAEVAGTNFKCDGWEALIDSYWSDQLSLALPPI